MKATLFTLIMALMSNFIQAQTVSFDWARHTGGDSSSVISKSVKVDSSGNIYTAGYFTDTVDFDPGTNVYNLISAGEYDIFITKSDASGNFVWARSVGSYGIDGALGMVIDASGNVYATGVFSNTVDFDPGSAKLNLSSAGSFDVFILKINTSGNLVWAKQLGGTDDELGYGIAVDASQNVYTTGSFEYTSDFDPGAGTYNLTAGGYDDIFVSKLNAAGDFVWARQFEGSNGNNSCQGYSIAVDAKKNVYTTGQFHDDVDFDPGSATNNLTTAGDLDIFISKLDSSGNFGWVKQMGGPYDDGGSSLTLDASANIHTTGYFDGSVDFDPGSGTVYLTSTNSADVFISKLDKSGNYVWARRLGGDNYEVSNHISLDASGNVYTIGAFQDSVDFNPGTSVYKLYSKGYNDVYISKLNSSGNFVWALQFGGSGSYGEGSSFTSDKAGNLYSTGYFSGTLNFDPGKSNYSLTSQAGIDCFISKFKECKATSRNLTVSACSTYVLNSQSYTSSGVYNQTIKNSAGCDSIITLNLTIKKPAFSITASDCNSYTLNAQTYTATGVYTQTVKNSKGCDSVITLNLTIKKTAAILNVNACTSYTLNSQTYTATGVYTQTRTNKAGCDSLITLNLTISSKATTGTINPKACNQIIINSQTYTSSGVYTQKLINKGGCDSTLTINLTINKSSASSLTTTACRSYKLNSQTYTSSGVYTQTLINKGGCDSIITLNLTINTVNKTVTQTGATLTANATGAAYQWLDCNAGKSPISGKTSQIFTAVKNGSYAVSVTQNSCKDTSICYTVTGLGVNNKAVLNGLTVFPNPTSGKVEIVLNTPLKNGVLKVINLYGQTVIENTNVNGSKFLLDINEHANGIYFIEINEGGNIYRTKIVKD